MKKILIPLLILFFCQTDWASPLEIEISGGVGNIAYDKSNTAALSGDEDNPGAFKPMYYPLVLARVSGEFGGLGYNVGFERESILRNRLFANIRLDHEYFFIEAGPVFGLFNTDKLPVNPGVSAALGLMYPGIIFAEAAGSSTLAAIPMEKEGNYSQISADLRAGFWVPYVICSFNMSLKSFSLREKTTLLIEDEQIRYFFRADAFTKNFPYTVRVDLGYQNLKRSYTSMEVVVSKIVQTSISDEFKSFFIGIEGIFSLGPDWKLLLGAEMPFYSWAERPMMEPPKSTILFEARMGFIWTPPVGNSKETSSAD